MEDSEPAKSALSKVPIPVEESRAQRLQKSQARFRDRGGIFVPTARNTLVDILLGRKVASPKKGRGRSASLSPKKKSVKSFARNNDKEVTTVRTSPRKAIRRQEPEAGPSRIHSQSAASKHQTAKESAEEAATPTTASKAKVKKGSEKLPTKKRGRKPKTAAQDAATPAPADHDPTPLAKYQPVTKTKRVSKAAKYEKPKLDSSAEITSNPKPERLPKAASETLLDGVTTEDDTNVKKSSRASKSKKPAASKRKPTASVHESEPTPSQQSSTGAGSSESRRTAASEADRRSNEMHSKGSAIVRGKGKRKTTQSTNLEDKLDVTAVEAPPKSRKKRARPVELETECPSPPKRVKQTPLKEAKSNAPRRKASRAKKETIQEDEENVYTESKDALSRSPLLKKRAREPDDEQTGAKRKKTKGVVHANPIPDETVDKQAAKSQEESKKNKKVEKTKKPSTSKTSRAKKGATKAPDQDKSPAETKTEPGVVFITRIRPRKSVIARMKAPQPDQIVNDDPDPINFLC